MAQKILVIEDEFLVALDIVTILEEAGFGEVEQVDNEEDALRRITEERWDGAVADANLYGCSIERIAQTLHQRGIPFVVVTGYSRESLPATVGSAPVIEKPFDAPNLCQTLVSLLRARTQ